MSKMIYDFVAGVHLAAHDGVVSDEEWAAYFVDIERCLPQMHGLIAYGPSPGPNLKQRGYANHFWDTHARKPIAVLTDAKVVRGAVLAFSWVMGTQIRAFAAADFAGAYSFLKLSAAQRALVDPALRRLYSSHAPEILGRLPLGQGAESR